MNSYLYFQISKPRLKSVLKQRRDSGLADTSDAENDGKKFALDSEPDDDAIASGNDDVTHNSILNVIDNKQNHKEPSESVIWKSDSEVFKEKNSKDQENKKKSDSLTCDNIKHNTDLYNPDKLNKGQYLEVMFKNDLIFDLDM